jgi:Ca-activated chloride channel family protein
MKRNQKPAKVPATGNLDKVGGGKNLNFLLFCLTFLAGCLWWLIGESVLIGVGKNGADFILRNPLLNGLYFAFLALFTLLACFISEKLVHSIVSEDFFNWAVNTPSLKITLLAAFTAVFLVSGGLEFLYELEPAKRQPIKKDRAAAITPEAETKGFDDYYFVVDSSGSMRGNDPQDERFSLLSRIVDTLSGDKRAGLVVFKRGYDIGDRKGLKVIIPLSSVDETVKTAFRTVRRVFNDIEDDETTYYMRALESTARLLDTDSGRKGVVILITDAERQPGDNSYFNSLVSLFTESETPVYTVLILRNTSRADENQLKSISEATGGKHSTVDNFVGFETQLKSAMDEEKKPAAEAVPAAYTSDPLRDILANRTGKRQRSALHALFHLAIITAVGLLLGYSLFTLFSHRSVKNPLIIGGGISGLLAGLVLEFGLQSAALPPPLVRMIACVILSTVIWSLSFMAEGIGRILAYRKKGDLRLLFSGDKEFNQWRSDSLEGKREDQPEGGIFEDKPEQKEETEEGVLK